MATREEISQAAADAVQAMRTSAPLQMDGYDRSRFTEYVKTVINPYRIGRGWEPVDDTTIDQAFGLINKLLEAFEK